MHEGRAIIAILGARDASGTEVALSMAKGVGTSLARGGYGLAILGSGGAPSAAASAAIETGGRVIAFAGPEMPVADLDREPGTFERRDHESYFAALEAILDISDAIVVIDPDIGSMALLLHVWSYGYTCEGPYRPLILLGEKWPKIVSRFADAAGLDRRSRAMLSFATDADEAVESLRYYVQPGE